MTLKHLSRYHKSKMCTATSLVVQWPRLCASKAGSLGSIPGHKTRSRMLQLRVCMPQLKLLHAVTKTQYSQIINTSILKSVFKSLLLGRKAMANLNSILKSRDITLSMKVCLVKTVVFPVVMYGCESWTIKKAEHQTIDAFELWCWRRLLRVPWTARRSNQSILKEISPEYSLEGPMMRLKLQYFGHLIQRANSLEKTLMCWERLKAGGEGDGRR